MEEQAAIATPPGSAAIPHGGHDSISNSTGRPRRRRVLGGRRMYPSDLPAVCPCGRCQSSGPIITSRTIRSHLRQYGVQPEVAVDPPMGADPEQLVEEGARVDNTGSPGWLCVLAAM
jgi:hypothetical protein